MQGKELEKSFKNPTWLVKSEPATYSWADLVQEGKTAWTGVRNFQARNFLTSMKNGDAVLFYHSGKEKAVVGLAQVCKEAYPDFTAEEGNWVCVELEPLRSLPKNVALSALRECASLQDTALLRQSRLSVMPLSLLQFQEILKLAGEVPIKG